jgi:integrase/recombinase XerD
MILCPIQLIPFDQWPVKSQIAWQQSLRRTGLRKGRYSLSRHDGEGQRRLMSAYGRWLGFVWQHAQKLYGKGGPDLISSELVEQYYNKLSETLAPTTVRGYIVSLNIALTAMWPENRYQELRDWVAYCFRTAKARKDKCFGLKSVLELYEYGFELIKTAQHQNTELQKAEQFRDGLMLTLLTACPIRRGNFASIEINNHLNKIGEQWFLFVASDEVKNKRFIEFPVPQELTATIELYISDVRPFLLSHRNTDRIHDPGDAFWINTLGDKMGAGWLGARVNQLTKKKWGKPMHFHQFRYAAATSVAIELPGNVGIIQSILTHSSILSSEKYYNQASTLEACRSYHQIIDVTQEGKV